MEQQVLNNMDITRILKDITLEIISRTGLKPSSKDNSTFELLWAESIHKTFPVFVDDLDSITEYEAIQKFKDNCINEFMILHHNHIVNKRKFNWNWDATR